MVFQFKRIQCIRYGVHARCGIWQALSWLDGQCLADISVGHVQALVKQYICVLDYRSQGAYGHVCASLHVKVLSLAVLTTRRFIDFKYLNTYQLQSRTWLRNMTASIGQCHGQCAHVAVRIRWFSLLQQLVWSIPNFCNKATRYCIL